MPAASAHRSSGRSFFPLKASARRLRMSSSSMHSAARHSSSMPTRTVSSHASGSDAERTRSFGCSSRTGSERMRSSMAISTGLSSSMARPTAGRHRYARAAHSSRHAGTGWSHPAGRRLKAIRASSERFHLLPHGIFCKDTEPHALAACALHAFSRIMDADVLLTRKRGVYV